MYDVNCIIVMKIVATEMSEYVQMQITYVEYLAFIGASKGLNRPGPVSHVVRRLCQSLPVRFTATLKDRNSEYVPSRWRQTKE